ncbi:MAG: carbohydrate-binding family 9-like protein [Armatimonadota bacterium]
MIKEQTIPTYNCRKVPTSPVIDGKLDDAVWSSVEGVVLVRTEAGEPAVKSTVVRMCWDDDNLYIAFECADTDIWGTLTQRDDPIYDEDVVEVFLSPDCDLEHYFEFELSPLNVIFDAGITNFGDSISADTDWDCNELQTAVLVDGTLNDPSDLDKGWTAEIAIPFASLDRETPKPGEVWRGNLYRIDRRPEPVEYQAWSPTLVDPASFHVPEKFGRIVFV